MPRRFNHHPNNRVRQLWRLEVLVASGMPAVSFSSGRPGGSGRERGLVGDARAAAAAVRHGGTMAQDLADLGERGAIPRIRVARLCRSRCALRTGGSSPARATARRTIVATAPRFANGDLAGAPVDVVKFKRHHLSGSKPRRARRRSTGRSRRPVAVATSHDEPRSSSRAVSEFPRPESRIAASVVCRC
jgi:hypothetical protein